MWPFLSLIGGGIWGFLKKAFSFAAKLPWQVWAVAAALLLGWFAWHWHVDQVKHADQAGYERAKVEDKARIDKLRDQALALKDKVEAVGVTVAGALKEEHDVEVVRIGADVAGIVRNGTGKAGCGRLDAPAAAASPGGHEPAARPAADPLGQVPDNGGSALIALPFNDFIQLAGQCDINRDEALKWRVNDDRQRAIWDAYRKSLAKPPK